MPPERASLRKLLTFLHRLHSPPLQGEGLGGVYLTRNAQKAQKSYASGSPPLGGGREGAFPFRGGFRRGFGGVRGGGYLTRKAQKSWKL